MKPDSFPSFDEIDQELDRFADANPSIAHVESLGVSAEGRVIRAAHVTDSSIPEDVKETALVICGRHGQELGTRVVGLALLDWLASAEGKQTRQHQLVIVVPVANPDGCVRGEFWAPQDGLSDTEENTIAALARTHQPDAVIDIHSWGDPLDGEAIVVANTSRSGEDVFIHESIAARMAEHAGVKGYPFMVRRTGLPGTYNNFFCGMCYGNFHSLVFGLEVNHYALKPDESAESGVAAVTALLGEGNTRSPWEAHPGYPNRIVAGNFYTSVRATGANSAHRRTSRSEIWKNRNSFTAPQREFSAPGTIRVRTQYTGRALPYGCALTCRIRGVPALKTIRLNGKKTEATTYEDNCSTYVSVDIRPSGKGTYELLVEF